MPAPKGGTVTSLSDMAAYLRSKNPSQGYSSGAQQRDVTRFESTFSPQRSIFGPGYPLVPPSRQSIRNWDYPAAWNTSFIPRSYEPISFGELRSLADKHTLTRLAVETRKDQIEALPWQIRVAGNDGLGRALKASKEQQGRIDTITKFFRYPDGTHRFETWLRHILDDLLVIDAPAVELRQTRGGKLVALDPLDGGTIKVLLDETGRRPKSPAPAYQQIIHGRPWVLLEDGTRADIDEGTVYADFNDGELIYMPRNLRTYKGYGFCYTADMQILTRRGWLEFGGLEDTDEVATRSPNTKRFEWQRPTAIIEKQHSGEVYHFHSRSVDLMVTPEHRMLVTALPRALGGGKGDRHWQRGGAKTEVILSAKELSCHLNHEIKIPMTSIWEGVPIEEKTFDLPMGVTVEAVRRKYRADGTRRIYTRTRLYGSQRPITISGNDYCALMGAYLAEGNLRSQGGIEINQHEDSKGFAPYRDLIARILGAPAQHNGSAFVLSHSHLNEYFSRFGHAHEKFIPDEIMNATPEQIRLFWDHFVLGDGHNESRPNKSGRGRGYASAPRITTVSERLADQLVELAQKLGWSASLRVKRSPGRAIVAGREANVRDAFIVSVRYSEAMSVNATRLKYEGPVHCVTVPNGIVYVRRNGKPAWCGNSPVEQIFTYMQIGIRREARQLAHFTEGNIPPGMIGAPEGATPEQVKEWQTWFDSTYGGNDSARTKIVWGPSGAKYQPFTEPPFKDDFDVWCARIVSYAFNLPASWATAQVNRATAETAQETALEEGLFPLKLWVVGFLNLIIQQRMKNDDLEFCWDEKADADPAIQATILTGYVKEGVYTRNEAREMLGKDPIEGGDNATVDTGQGPVLVTDIEDMSDLTAHPPEPAPPAAVSGGGGAAGKKPATGNGKPASTPKPKAKPAQNSQKTAADEAEGLDRQSVDQGIKEAAEGGADPFGEPASRRYLATARDAIAKVLTGFFREEAPRIAADVLGHRHKSSAAETSQKNFTKVDRKADHTNPDRSGVATLDDPLRAREISAAAAASLGAIDWSRWSGLAKEISPLLEAAAVQTVVDTLAALPGESLTEAQLEAAKAEARKWARDRAAELVGRSNTAGRTIPDASAENDITDSTARMIAEDVREAITHSVTPDELTTFLRESPALSPSRAKRIADTETKTALHTATMQAFKASNRVKGSYWVTVNDERVESVCLINELASPVRLGHPFPSGHTAPLAHPNCRCYLTPWM